MGKLIFTFILWMITINCFAANIAANNANINYIGRWTDTTVSSTPIKAAISGGTRLRFQFSGTSLAANFDMGSPQYTCTDTTILDQATCTSSYMCCGYNGSGGACSTSSYNSQDDCQNDGGSWTPEIWQLTPFYAYYPVIESSIDGGAWTRATIAASVTLATGLASGTHTVDLYSAGINGGDNKWNDLAGVRVSGFVVDSGAIVSPWPTGLPRMLSIGDSITEGMLNLGSTQGTSTSSGRLSFSTQLATLLGMENWNVAFGGTGFYGTSVNGNVPATQVNYLYKSAGVPQSDPLFNIVLVAAGNNDGDTSGVVTQYQTLLSEIATNNPTAKIFCLGRTYGSVGDLVAAQTKCSAYGGTYISTVPLTGLVSLPNLGHPSVADDTVIANYLKPFLAPYVQGITKIPAVRSGDVPLKRTGVPATR